MTGPIYPAGLQREEDGPRGHFFSRGERAISLFGEEILASGTIHFRDGTVRLDGRLEGKIVGQGTLIIGEKGSLKGEVDVGGLILCGRVDGKVDVSGLTHITQTGNLLGKVHSACLVVDAGGVLEGESQTGPREEDPAGV